MTAHPEVVGSIAPESPALASDVRPQLPWPMRVQNRVRMAICNWLGLTFVLGELNRRAGGNRMDIEVLAENAQGMRKTVNDCVTQTNRNTKLLGVFQQYPVLGKLAAEQRTRDAKAAKKVLSNGEGSQIVDAKGKLLAIQSPLVCDESSGDGDKCSKPFGHNGFTHTDKKTGRSWVGSTTSPESN
jgi:hypothetical protein